MNKSFRCLRTANVPTKVQGFIYYAMLNKHRTKPEIVDYCLGSIDEVTIDPTDRKMLKEYVSTEKSRERICMDYSCSPRKLDGLYHKYVCRVYYHMCSG